MSTSLEDMKGGMSNCCGAQVYLDQMICSACKEHCDIEPDNSRSEWLSVNNLTEEDIKKDEQGEYIEVYQTSIGEHGEIVKNTDKPIRQSIPTFNHDSHE